MEDVETSAKLHNAHDKHQEKRHDKSEFQVGGSPLLLVFQNLPPFEYLAYHSSELPYLFEFGSVTLNPAQQQLSEQMIRAWGRFATWSGYPQVLSLAPGAIQPVDYEAEHQCEFWSSVR